MKEAKESNHKFMQGFVRTGEEGVRGRGGLLGGGKGETGVCIWRERQLASLPAHFWGSVPSGPGVVISRGWPAGRCTAEILA